MFRGAHYLTHRGRIREGNKAKATRFPGVLICLQCNVRDFSKRLKVGLQGVLVRRPAQPTNKDLCFAHFEVLFGDEIKHTSFFFLGFREKGRRKLSQIVTLTTAHAHMSHVTAHLLSRQSTAPRGDRRSN